MTGDTMSVMGYAVTEFDLYQKAAELTHAQAASKAGRGRRWRFDSYTVPIKLNPVESRGMMSSMMKTLASVKIGQDTANRWSTGQDLIVRPFPLPKSAKLSHLPALGFCRYRPEPRPAPRTSTAPPLIILRNCNYWLQLGFSSPALGLISRVWNFSSAV